MQEYGVFELFHLVPTDISGKYLTLRISCIRKGLPSIFSTTLCAGSRENWFTYKRNQLVPISRLGSKLGRLPYVHHGAENTQ